MGFFDFFREPKPQEPDPTGCLFGLTPPPGCVFEVSLHRGSSWHVYIYRGARRVVHECELILNDRETDEEIIVRAARKALDVYEKVSRRSHLEGVYPPKRAGRAA